MTTTLSQAVIAFTVHGLAQPAGSKRAFPFARATGGLGVRVADDNPKSRTWKNYVSTRAREVYQGPILQGPLRVRLAFFLPRPKGHFGAKGLRPSSPPWPATRPDVLKLARGVEDALTGVLWRDDAQIVEEFLSKEFGDHAHVSIGVEVLGDRPGELWGVL